MRHAFKVSCAFSQHGLRNSASKADMDLALKRLTAVEEELKARGSLAIQERNCTEIIAIKQQLGHKARSDSLQLPPRPFLDPNPYCVVCSHRPMWRLCRRRPPS